MTSQCKVWDAKEGGWTALGGQNKARFKGSDFAIRHFGSVVPYSAEGFCDKNFDRLDTVIASWLFGSIPNCMHRHDHLLITLIAVVCMHCTMHRSSPPSCATHLRPSAAASSARGLPQRSDRSHSNSATVCALSSPRSTSQRVISCAASSPTARNSRLCWMIARRWSSSSAAAVCPHALPHMPHTPPDLERRINSRRGGAVRQHAVHSAAVKPRGAVHSTALAFTLLPFPLCSSTHSP